MRLLSSVLLMAGLVLSAFMGAACASPPPPGDLPEPDTFDLTLLLSPVQRRMMEEAFVDYDQLVSTNNPVWTMFGTNPPPANNMCTLDMADAASGFMVGGAKLGLDRHDHIIARMNALLNSDGSLAGINVPSSGYYGTYCVSADRATAIKNNFNSFKSGDYRTKYNAVFTKKAAAYTKAEIAGEACLQCTVFPKSATSAERADALSNLMDKVADLETANAALLSALNSAVSKANALRSSSQSAAFPDGNNGFGGLPLDRIWVSQGMVYWWYISQGYVDQGHWYLPDGATEQEYSAGWPYGTPPTEQPSYYAAQMTTVGDWYLWLQPPGGITPWRWQMGLE